MSDTKHISEIIDSIGYQQAELKKLFSTASHKKESEKD